MSQLVPLYADALTRGDLPIAWKGRALPDIENAQQQFVRYPVAGESMACSYGWARPRDAIACSSVSVVRSLLDQLLV
jgi:hypothetical protein